MHGHVPCNMCSGISFGRVICARNSSFTHCVIHVSRVVRDLGVVRRLVSGVPRKPVRRGVGPVVQMPRKDCCATIRNDHNRFKIFLRDRNSGAPCHLRCHSAKLPLISTISAVYQKTGVTSLVTVNKALSCIMPSVSEWKDPSNSCPGSKSLRSWVMGHLVMGVMCI